MAQGNPDDIVAAALQSSRNIKFGRGVVSKTTVVAVGVVAVWGAIAWRLGENITLNATLLIAGVLATAFAVWYTRSSQNYAERNPAQALLEGAEFLEWTRLEAAAKGLPSPDSSALVEISSK